MLKFNPAESAHALPTFDPILSEPPRALAHKGAAVARTGGSTAVSRAVLVVHAATSGTTTAPLAATKTPLIRASSAT